MKRFFELAVCCLSIFVFADCGTDVSLKDISVTGADGTIYNSYQTACSKGDFDAARDYIGKMKEKFIVVKADGDYKEKEAFKEAIQEAEDYVIKQEAFLLMTQNDESAKKRILFLLKEIKTNNDLVSTLIDLALDNDDEEFVKTLANQYSPQAKIPCEKQKALMGYLVAKDKERNIDYILSYINKYGKQSNSLSCLIDNLAQLNNKQFSDMIIATLTNTHIDGERPKIGRQVRDGTGPYESYQNSIQGYNHKCLRYLDVAIKFGNLYLAKRVVRMIRTNYHLNSVWKNDKMIYNVSEDQGDLKEARRLLDEAVKSGAFN